MNDRIKQLREESLSWAVETLDSGKLNDYEWGVAVDGKFAELIVLACAVIAKDSQDFYDEHNDGVCNTDISGLLKYTFGVE